MYFSAPRTEKFGQTFLACTVGLLTVKCEGCYLFKKFHFI
jgi:hypothetical protein